MKGAYLQSWTRVSAALRQRAKTIVAVLTTRTRRAERGKAENKERLKPLDAPTIS